MQRTLILSLLALAAVATTQPVVTPDNFNRAVILAAKLRDCADRRHPIADTENQAGKLNYGRSDS
jgi:hypothetical protein